MELDQDIDNICKVVDIAIVPMWKDCILQYMKKNPCKDIADYIEKKCSIDYLKKNLGERRKRYKPAIVQMLTEFADAVEELYYKSSQYNNMYKTGPILQPGISKTQFLYSVKPRIHHIVSVFIN